MENNNQANMTKVDINFVLAEYQQELAKLGSENLMFKAYVKQLEAKVKELESKLAEQEQK